MRSMLLPKFSLWRAANLTLFGFVLAFLLAPRLALASDEVPNGQGLLWKVERAGIAPSYLFGTIHISDERVIDLPAPVRATFDGAQSATFEVIMTDALRVQMAHAMLLSDGRTLDQIVGPALYGEATAAGARYGLVAEQLKHFKPWALAMVFSVPQAELARSATGRVPLDQWLQTEARRQGKPLYALESGDEQIALFNELSDADQLAMLESAIRDNAEIERLFESMTQRYLAGDIGGIYTDMLLQSKTMNEQLIKLFLMRFAEDRNRTMARRMAERLSEGGAFIAIGALHLPGESGLIRLLQQDGYAVERVY